MIGTAKNEAYDVVGQMKAKVSPYEMVFVCQDASLSASNSLKHGNTGL